MIGRQKYIAVIPCTLGSLSVVIISAVIVSVIIPIVVVFVAVVDVKGFSRLADEFDFTADIGEPKFALARIVRRGAAIGSAPPWFSNVRCTFTRLPPATGSTETTSP